ncbi:hypothetical protein D039_1150B, partial [Vibrio parahaemolyticus EKP-028]
TKGYRRHRRECLPKKHAVSARQINRGESDLTSVPSRPFWPWL